MDKFKPLFLALAVAILLLPLAFYVRKFSLIEPKVSFKVAFNPVACYQCRNCSCEFTVDEEKTYILNRYDKTLCKVGHEAINEGLDKGLSYMTVDMKISQYREFLDCAQWYSLHPSTYGVDYQ